MVLAYWLLDALVAADLPLPIPVGDEMSIDAASSRSPRPCRLHRRAVRPRPGNPGITPDVVPVLKNENVPRAPGAAASQHVLAPSGAGISQVALSLIALAAAGLFLQSLTGRADDTGFETRGVLVMNINLGRDGYTPERGQLFYEQAANVWPVCPASRLRPSPRVLHSAAGSFGASFQRAWTRRHATASWFR